MGASRRHFWPGGLAALALLGVLAGLAMPSDGRLLPALPQQAAADLRPALPLQAPGPVSIGFAQDMTLHHEQALVMARLALQQGTPPIRAFAQGVVDAQLKEIGYLQGWLLLWDQPAMSATDAMDWMRDAYRRARRRDEVFEAFIDACSAGGGMPGLATPQQLEQLSQQRGAAFDLLFLALMTRHHQGAVVMAQFAYQHAEHQAVRGFALSMGAEQRREWMQMAALRQAAR